MTPAEAVRYLLEAPGARTGFRVEPDSLPRLGWLPQNGGPGQPTINTDAEQGYSRGQALIDVRPYPPTIGWVQGLLPLADIWTMGQGYARLPGGPYTGGDYVREQGGTEMGLGSRYLKIPKLLG